MTKNTVGVFGVLTVLCLGMYSDLSFAGWWGNCWGTHSAQKKKNCLSHLENNNVFKLYTRPKSGYADDQSKLFMKISNDNKEATFFADQIIMSQPFVKSSNEKDYRNRLSARYDSAYQSLYISYHPEQSKNKPGVFVNGSMNANELEAVSDQRTKKDIVSIGAIAKQFMELEPVIYDVKVNSQLWSYDYPENNVNQIGFLAQDLGKLFKYAFVKDKEGVYSVKPLSISTLTIKALQEINSEKEEELRRIKEKYEKRIYRLKAKLNKINNGTQIK